MRLNKSLSWISLTECWLWVTYTANCFKAIDLFNQHNIFDRNFLPFQIKIPSPRMFKQLNCNQKSCKAEKRGVDSTSYIKPTEMNEILEAVEAARFPGFSMSSLTQMGASWVPVTATRHAFHSNDLPWGSICVWQENIRAAVSIQCLVEAG